MEDSSQLVRTDVLVLSLSSYVWFFSSFSELEDLSAHESNFGPLYVPLWRLVRVYFFLGI